MCRTWPSFVEGVSRRPASSRSGSVSSPGFHGAGPVCRPTSWFVAAGSVAGRAVVAPAARQQDSRRRSRRPPRGPQPRWPARGCGRSERAVRAPRVGAPLRRLNLARRGGRAGLLGHGRAMLASALDSCPRGRVSRRRVRSGRPQGFPDLAFFVAAADTPSGNPARRLRMSFLDKIMGRGKKAAGDVTGDDSMRKRGHAPGGRGHGVGARRERGAAGSGRARERRRASRGALGHLNRRCNGAFEGGESRPRLVPSDAASNVRRLMAIAITLIVLLAGGVALGALAEPSARASSGAQTARALDELLAERNARGRPAPRGDHGDDGPAARRARHEGRPPARARGASRRTRSTSSSARSARRPRRCSSRRRSSASSSRPCARRRRAAASASSCSRTCCATGCRRPRSSSSTASPSGERVDAVIKVDRIVPIDSKFPLDNFERHAPAPRTTSSASSSRSCSRATSSTHVDAIASQVHPARRGHVRLRVHVPPVGGDLLRARLREAPVRCSRTRTRSACFPVSPTTLTAYLQVIVLGLKGLQIEQHAHEVMAYCAQLQKDFGTLQGRLRAGRHAPRSRAEQVRRRREAARASSRRSSSRRSDSQPEPVEPARPRTSFPRARRRRLAR